MLWIGGVLALAALAAAFVFDAHFRLRRLEAWRFPPHLSRRVRARYPHLSDADCETVIEGMRQFFAVSLLARRGGVAMPSQAVDVAWHEFILSTRAYQQFCTTVLGRFLHHTPAEAMASGRAQGDMRRAWALACRREGIDPKSPRALPLLFAIDATLKIPDGFTYALNCSAARARSLAGADGGGGGGGGVIYCASDMGCSGGGGCSGGDSADSGCSGGGCSGGCGGGD